MIRTLLSLAVILLASCNVTFLRSTNTNCTCITIQSGVYNEPSEQDCVIDSALYDPDPEIRKIGLKNTNCINVINQVALNDSDPEIRKLALSRTSSFNTIKEVALKDSDPKIRELARRRLEN